MVETDRRPCRVEALCEVRGRRGSVGFETAASPVQPYLRYLRFLLFKTSVVAGGRRSDPTFPLIVPD